MPKPGTDRRIFLNYRREDSAGYAGRLFDELTRRFGDGAVFMDIDTLRPGTDFVEAIERAVQACDVLVAVVGRNWLTVTDRTGRPRLESPNDFVRLEIAGALNKGLRVIPVLVGGATMPAEDEVPQPLAALARRHALELSDRRWKTDVQELLALVEADSNDQPWPAPVRFGRGVHPNNLPAPVDDFVGRGVELAQVIALLGDRRLITLIGPGGVGKTRLALVAAAAVADGFTGGVWLVRLDAVRDGRFVPHAIAAAIGLRDQGDRPVLEMVRDYVSGRRILLVLDNFEHLPDAASVVSELLGGAPGLVVLVTSRAALRLPGEWIYPVPPLPTTAVSNEWPEGAELFRRRAAASGGSVPGDPLLDTIIGVCERLDGLPLAIELAASRVRTLGVAELARRLDHRLNLLTGGAGGRPTRQRTLRGTIAWSYELLDGQEQRTFRSLAVFHGGWTLDAAQRVVGARDQEMLDGLSSLVDESLVVPDTEHSNPPRFRMLETLREFGLEQLDAAGEMPTVLRRHAEHFLQVAAEAEPELTGPRPTATLDRLEADRDNLRAAVLWAVSTEQPEIGVGIGGRLWRFYQLRAHLSEGRRLLDDLLSLDAHGKPQPWRAQASLALAGITYWQQDYDTSRHWYQTALDLFRALGDEVGRAEASDGLAFHLLMAGDIEAARAHIHDAQTIFTRRNDTAGVARSLDRLALMAVAEGDFDTARRWAEQSLSAWNRVDQAFGRTNTLSLLGSIERQQGALDEAAQQLRAATDAYLEIGNLSGLNWMLWEFAALSEARGDLQTAVLLASAAEALAQEIGGGALVTLLHITAPYERAANILGSEQLSALRTEGRQLSWKDAIALGQSAKTDTKSAPSDEVFRSENVRVIRTPV